MKSTWYAWVAAVAFAAPVASFAQENAPVTRAQVRADLQAVEQAGYNPAGHSPYYPADIQAAEARVDAQNGTAQAAVSGPAANSGYGPVSSGASQAGAPAAQIGQHSIYFGAH